MPVVPQFTLLPHLTLQPAGIQRSKFGEARVCSVKPTPIGVVFLGMDGLSPLLPTFIDMIGESRSLFARHGPSQLKLRTILPLTAVTISRHRSG